MYALQNNVYIVKGACKYAIYDLNACKLYSIDKDCYRYINDIINDFNNKVPSDIFDYLVDNGIIVDENDKVDMKKSFVFTGEILFAWIEITQNCNLMCRHCYEGSSRIAKKSEMSYDDFRDAIDTLVRLNVKRIQLVGGEPLIHPQIKLFINYVIGKFDFIEIFTNGTLLSDDLIDIIAKNNIHLAFSVYSDNAETHDYVTCTKGSFVLTSNRIKQAIDKGIKIRTASVEMKNVPRFTNNGSKEHKCDFPRITGRADLSLYSEDMLKRKIITKNTFAKPIKPVDFFKNQKMHYCFGEKIYIDYKLNVYPCAMERRVSYGKLSTIGDKKLLDNEYATLTKDKIIGCRDCEYRYACFDCRADSCDEAIDSKPWYCSYDQEKGEWIDEDAFVSSLLDLN